MAASSPLHDTQGPGEFLRHLHPRVVSVRSLKFSATFGLGLVATFLWIILVGSGALLMVYYVPSAGGAYGSIQDLMAVVPYGRLARNLHRWAGHGLVAVVGLHLLRALLSGAYQGQARRGIWTTGIWLLLLVLGLAFTGYLLPWDQLSYWAVQICGQLAANLPGVGPALRHVLWGGDVVSGATLVRFYALHVGLLPLGLTIFLVLHLYRLRRAGGLARPVNGVDDVRVPAWPHFYERELALLALVMAVVLALGLLVQAPLGPEPDPSQPADPSKAPWYFLFLQELVSYSTLLGGVVLPFFAFVVLVSVPWLDARPSLLGRRVVAALWTGGALAGLVLVAAPLMWREGFGGEDLWRGGLHPATALTAGSVLAAAVSWVVARRRRPVLAARVALMVLVGIGTSAWLVLTLVGWGRGPSWVWGWPWGNG